jgi:hypothetical protein
MSFVTFQAETDERDDRGWPMKLIGDGFIHIDLWHSDYRADEATYRDQFGDEYVAAGVDGGEWSIDVREDG